MSQPPRQYPSPGSVSKPTTGSGSSSRRDNSSGTASSGSRGGRLIDRGIGGGRVPSGRSTGGSTGRVDGGAPSGSTSGSVGGSAGHTGGRPTVTSPSISSKPSRDPQRGYGKTEPPRSPRIDAARGRGESPGKGGSSVGGGAPGSGVISGAPGAGHSVGKIDGSGKTQQPAPREFSRDSSRSSGHDGKTYRTNMPNPDDSKGSGHNGKTYRTNMPKPDGGKGSVRGPHDNPPVSARVGADRGHGGGHDRGGDSGKGDRQHAGGGHDDGKGSVHRPSHIAPGLGSIGRSHKPLHRELGGDGGSTIERSALHDPSHTHERHHYEAGHHDGHHDGPSGIHFDTRGRHRRYGYGRDIDIDINYYGYGPHYGHYFYDGCWNLYPRWHNHSYSYISYSGGYDYCRDYVYNYPCDEFGYYHWNDYSYVYPRFYYSRRPSSSFYFFVDLGGYEERYVPTYVANYQANYYATEEPVDVFESRNPVDAAYAAFAERRYYRSIVDFDRALGERPDDGLLYFARAQAYIAVGDYRSAYDDIIRGMDLVPDWGRVRFNMRELYGDPQEFDKQLGELEGWVDSHPDDFRAHFTLGYVYYFLQEYDLSKAEMVRTLSIVSNHAQADRLVRDIYERQVEAEENRKRVEAEGAPATAAPAAPAPSR